jgi:hypothetical protein
MLTVSRERAIEIQACAAAGNGMLLRYSARVGRREGR